MKRKILLFAFCVIMVISALVLTSCKDPLELDAPANIRYDGSTITWDAVENASGYSVSINEGNAYNVSSNKYPYSAKGESFSVKITAVSKSEDFLDSLESNAVFFGLETIKDLTVSSEGVFSWSPIENATAYEIRVDNKVVATTNELSYTGFEAGNHIVQVRPVVENDPSYYSSWSASKSIVVLGSVNPDDINYVNGMIKWKHLTGAQSYCVSVNGVVINEKCSGTQTPFDPGNENFEVTIKALGNGATTFDGKESEPKSFIFLSTITNIKVENGILKWDEIDGATGYRIMLNGNLYPQTLTTCEFTGLVAGSDMEVSVMPVSEDTSYFSNWSAPKTVRILQAPVLMWNSSLELDGEANNNAYWDLVANATGYTVKLTHPDGHDEEFVFGETQKSFAFAYNAVGTYTVAVKAIAPATDSNMNDSQYSTPITVNRLASPSRADSNFITSDPTNVSEGFIVTFKSVASATQYRIYQDNVLLKSGTNTQFVVSELVEEGTLDEQHYNFKIQSVGNVDNVNGRIYVTLSSLTSEALAFDITVLAVPTTPNISGYEYSFGTVNGNNGYVVDINGEAKTTDMAKYNLETLQTGNYNVRACAKGNGSNVLSSNYSSPISVVRLSAPNNVKILTSEASEGVITYDLVQFATSYEIIFDNSANAIPVTDMMNVNQYITEQGTTVCMQSVANYFNNEKTIYYMTSPRGETVNFVKLATPTFGDVAFSNTQLIWKAPENINSAIYTPTYTVYDANGLEYVGEKNGVTMDISYLEGGQEYVFYVKAIGNGTSYVNSQKSTAVTIYKIATPTVTKTSDGTYAWNDVINATGYIVYIDGIKVGEYTNSGAATYSHTPKFDEIKTYKVEVEAVGDNGYTSITSKRALIEQEIKQLSSPDFTIAYSHEQYDKEGKIQVTITQESLYATGYSYTIGGATFTSTELTCEHNPSSTGEYTVSVFALGGGFDEEGVYYINSQRTGGNSSYSIKLLDITNKSEINITRQGLIKWAASSLGATYGYNIEISINGGSFEMYEAGTPSFTVENFSDVKTIKVRIQAKGNESGTVIASEWVESDEFVIN